MTLHKIGVRIDGKLHTAFGTIKDEDFAVVAKHGLPQGLVAWHIEENELDEPASARVQAIRKLPHLANDWQDVLEQFGFPWRELPRRKRGVA